MRKIYSFLKSGSYAVKSLFLSLFCFWAVASATGQVTIVGSSTNYTTIQAAVTAANSIPGPVTINVAAGTYNEGYIEITKPLTILGPQATVSPNVTGNRTNSAAEAVINVPPVPSTATSPYQPAFIVRPSATSSSYAVVIKGFTFNNGSPVQDGHMGYSAQTPVDVTFEYNIVRNGEYIYGGYYWRDININFNNINNPLRFSSEPGRADAIYLLGGRNVNVNDNVITTADVGILVKGSVDKGANAQITSINILRNSVSTTNLEGIQIGESMLNGLVSNNEVTGATSVGGIRIYKPTIGAGGTVNITNNIVKNTPAGVIFTDGNADQELYVRYNSLDLSNTQSIVMTPGTTTGTLKATCNWLGTKDCAIIAGRVTGSVKYSPFLQDSTDDAPTTIGFQTHADCKACCTLAATVATKTDVKCYGNSDGTVSFTVTGESVGYRVDNSTTNLKNVGNPVIGLTAGTYSFNIIDSNGCKVTVPVTIGQPAAALNASATGQQNIDCTHPTGSVTINATGGTGSYTGIGLQQNLAVGNNTFTVTDSNGCKANVSVNITKTDCPPPTCTLKASITSQTNVSCYGGNNGSITITATGGVGTVTGAGTFSNLAAGNYSYKVTDGNKCEVYVSFNITQPDSLIAPYTQKNASCKGASDGSVTFTISGGTSPYTIKNVTTGANNISNPVTGLKAGTYTFLITDKNNCCKTVTVCITEPSTPCVLPCKVTVTTVDAPYCTCSAKGSATFTFTGKAPFKYTITPCGVSGTSSDNTETVSLNDGNYTIKVTDAAGCVSTANFTINKADPITASISVKLNTTFPGQKSNTIYVGYTTQYATLSATNVKGGTPPYTYKWYPSSGLTSPNSDQTIANPTCTTVYTLVITDSKGCKFYRCVTLKVIDVRCGKYNNQVEICYKGKTCCVDKTLVSGYLATGATLGSCGCDNEDDDDQNSWWDHSITGTTTGDGGQGQSVGAGSSAIGVYPNPTGGLFRVSVDAINEPVQIVISDAKGKAITTTSRINSTTAGQTFDFNLSTQPAGMYLVHIVQGQLQKTYKVFIIR